MRALVATWGIGVLYVQTSTLPMRLLKEERYHGKREFVDWREKERSTKSPNLHKQTPRVRHPCLTNTCCGIFPIPRYTRGTRHTCRYRRSCREGGDPVRYGLR